ncbi:MAG: WG repeat-containing protein, partial [Bacteroidetes bacterium]
TRGENLIPVEFDRLKMDWPYLKAYNPPAMTLFEFDDSLQVARKEFFAQVYTLEVGYETDLFGSPLNAADASSTNVVTRTNRGARLPNPPPATPWQSFTPPPATGQFIWASETDNGPLGLLDSVNEKWVIPPQYKSVNYIPEADLTLVYSAKNTFHNKITRVTASPVDTICSMALFDQKTGKFLTGFEFSGIAVGDFQKGLPFARLLDADGQFGLINRQGRQVTTPDGQPRRFSYIGPFSNDKAVVCMNGTPAKAIEAAQIKYAPDSYWNLFTNFAILPVRRDARSFRERFYFQAARDADPVWGYIDPNGNLVIDTMYNYATDFTGGFAIAQKDGKMGVINEKNEAVLPFLYTSITPFQNNWKIGIANDKPILYNRYGHEAVGLDYDRFGGFSEGYCAVQRDSLWGFVNSSGEEVIPCQYLEARKFSEGRAGVFSEENGWQFVDTAGNVVLWVSDHIEGVESVGRFKNGLCWIKIAKWYGYMNGRGEVVIKPQFTRAFDFQNGVARCVFERKTGLIDTLGNWVLPPKQFEVIYPFDENGVAEVREHFKKERGLINQKGALIVPVKYRKIIPSKEGYYKITDGNYWGLVDAKGREILPVKYTDMTDIGDGLTGVRLPGMYRWFFVNTQNKRAFKGDFEIAESFQNGFAYVQKNEFDPETHYFIDSKGHPFSPPNGEMQFVSEGIFGMYSDKVGRGMRPPQYFFTDQNGFNLFNQTFEKIEPFRFGRAPVRLNNRWGMISSRGLFLIPPKFPKITIVEPDLIYTRPGLLFGLANRKGDILIEPRYDLLEDMGGGIIRLERGEAVGYWQTDGTWLWPLQK